VLGGLFVILPLAVLIFVFVQLYQFTTRLLQPLTDLIRYYTPLPEFVADVIGIASTILFFFLTGLLIKTQIGTNLFKRLEKRFFNFIPGYEMVKEIVLQFSGKKNMPFTRVALVDLHGDAQLVTGFITDEHGPHGYTIFVPTSPMPTSGIIYHLPTDRVHPIDIPAEDAMRSIISCGVGSGKLIENYVKSESNEH